MPWKGSDWRSSWTRQKGCTWTRRSQHGIQWVKVPQQHPSFTTHSQHQCWEGPIEKHSFQINLEPKSYYLTYMLGLMHDFLTVTWYCNPYFHEVNIVRQHIHHTAHASIWCTCKTILSDTNAVIHSSDTAEFFTKTSSSNSTLDDSRNIPPFSPPWFTVLEPALRIPTKVILYLVLIPQWHIDLMGFLLVSKRAMLALAVGHWSCGE